jgi:enediyne biosynthesis protein E5
MEDKGSLRITARSTRDGPSGYHIVRVAATPTAAPPSRFKNNFRARGFYQEMDPRWLQIAFLSSFLACGLWLGVVPSWQPPLCLAAALVAQEVGRRLTGAPASTQRSAIITGLGLSLLLRTDLVWLAPLAAVLAIGSKFLLRFRGKHLFNPANFGLVACMLVTAHVWCSPSQWGENALLRIWFLVLGLAVVNRAFRTDTSLAFLGCWIALKAARVLYLGQSSAVFLHQLEVGSLIVFTFFMISDPKTTPDHRLGRVIFAAAVASLGFYIEAHLWIRNGPIWALFFFSPLVPVLDHLLRAARYEWPGALARHLKSQRSPA